jgi:hypothetical protein
VTGFLVSLCFLLVTSGKGPCRLEEPQASAEEASTRLGLGRRPGPAQRPRAQHRVCSSENGGYHGADVPPPSHLQRLESKDSARNKGGAAFQRQTMGTFAVFVPPSHPSSLPGRSGGPGGPGWHRGVGDCNAAPQTTPARGPGRCACASQAQEAAAARAASLGPGRRGNGLAGGRGRAAAAAISAASCSSRPRRHGNGVTHRSRFPARLARVTPAARAPSSLT